jgi:hypothetical protein
MSYFVPEVKKQYVVEHIPQDNKTLNLVVSHFDKNKGQVLYVNGKWAINYVHYVNKQNVDILYCTFTTESGFTLTIVGVYKHIKQSVSSVLKLLDIIYNNMPSKCLCCHQLCITGDLNIQTNTLNPLCLSKFHLYELAMHTPTTVYNTKIDYIFTTHPVDECVNNIIPCDWSDHHILFFQIPETTQLLARHNAQCVHTLFDKTLHTRTREQYNKILRVIRDMYAVEYNVFWCMVSTFSVNSLTIQFEMCTTLRQKWIFVIYHNVYSDIVWFDSTTCYYVRLLGTLDAEHNNNCIDVFTLKHYSMPERVTEIHVPVVALPLITGHFVHNVCFNNDITDCQPLTMLNWTDVLTNMLDAIAAQVP